MKRSTAYLFAGVFGLLLCSVTYAGLSAARAKDRAERAVEQTHDVQALAAEIITLSDRPTYAVASTEETRQLSGLIEQAAAASNINQARIESITAQAPRRVGQSPYYRVPTRVGIDGVQLGPLLALLHTLTREDQIRLEGLRLSAPHGEIVGSTWNAEFTLAYLMYAPPTPEAPTP